MELLGALQRKHQKLLTLDADLVVIQECSKPDMEQIGRCEDWLSLSDHSPVLVELDL
jgi:hypothetical protein